MLKILFLTKYSRWAGSSRYMTYDYLEYYQRAGFECVVSPLLDDRYVQLQSMARPTRLQDLISNLGYYKGRLLQRLGDISSSSGYDLVVLEKELLPYAPLGLEANLGRRRRKLISMYDDAIHAYYKEHPWKFLRWLCRDKIEKIMELSSHVVVWNEVLEAYARRWNAKVSCVHLGIDLRRYQVKQLHGARRPVILGWIGTPSTLSSLDMLAIAFHELAKKYPLELHVITSVAYRNPHIRVVDKPWSIETEVKDLQECDIGIMPLPDNEWTRGKSGCKLLQYMGVGLPVVASPVGVNQRIVRNGVNGFLANAEEEWISALSQLIENAELRRSQGEAGRKMVEEDYAQDKTAAKLISIFYSVLNAHE